MRRFRKRSLLVWAAVGTIVGAGFYYMTPRIYVSSAVIQIVPPRITTDLVKRQPRPSLTVRLDALISRVRTRTKLETLIMELNLYEEMRQRDVMEDVVARMNRDIEVRPISEDTFQVAYKTENRVVPLRVTARLAQLFIDEQYIDRQFSTEGTVQFLESQTEELRSRLSDWEELTLKHPMPPGRGRDIVIEHEVLEERYKVLYRELMAARMAAAIDRSEIGEQFRLLEAARAPETPISPPLLPFLGWGAFGGIVARLLVRILSVNRHKRGLRVALYVLLAIVLLVVGLLIYLLW